MKKTSSSLISWSAILTTMALTLLLHLLLYPSTLVEVEAEGFFVSTSDFIHNTLLQPAGLTVWGTYFLEHLFVEAYYGSLLIILLCLSASIAFYLLWRNSYLARLTSVATIALYLYLALVVFTDVFALLSANLVLWAFVVYTHLPRPVGTILFTALLPLGYMLIPFPALILVGIGYAAINLKNGKGTITCSRTLKYCAFLFAIPLLWNHYIGYLGSEHLFIAPALHPLPLLLYVILAASLLYLIPSGKFSTFLDKINVKVQIVLILCAGIAFAYTFANHPDRQQKERLCALKHAAEAEDWNRVLHLYHNEAEKDAFTLRYALLAEAGLGTLPHHLLNYPISSAEDFVFRHNYSIRADHFNSLFYRHLGFPDESFHQAFEGSTLSPRGFTMRSLRMFTEASLAVGDTTLAQKYIDILSTTCTHGEWAARQTVLLKALTHGEIVVPPAPLRSFNFVGAAPTLTTEWTYALDAHPNNRRLFDYLACAFLLNKQPEKLARLMELTHTYERQTLPPLYAQAMALFAEGRPQWQGRFIIPTQVIQEWNYCQQLHQQRRMQELAQRTRGTYWYYLFFVNNRPSTPARP